MMDAQTKELVMKLSQTMSDMMNGYPVETAVEALMNAVVSNLGARAIRGHEMDLIMACSIRLQVLAQSLDWEVIFDAH